MVVTAWICFLAFAWGDLGLFTPLPTAMAGIAAGFGIALYRSTVQAPQVLGAPR